MGQVAGSSGWVKWCVADSKLVHYTPDNIPHINTPYHIRHLSRMNRQKNRLKIMIAITNTTSMTTTETFCISIWIFTDRFQPLKSALNMNIQNMHVWNIRSHWKAHALIKHIEVCGWSKVANFFDRVLTVSRQRKKRWIKERTLLLLLLVSCVVCQDPTVLVNMSCDWLKR